MLHNDHRKRLRKRFLNAPEAMEKHELIELLLTFCIPRKDTNPTAHRLLNRFKNISGILDAQIKELQLIEGLGEVSCSFLKLIKSIIRIYLEEKVDKVDKKEDKKLTIDDVGSLLAAKFVGIEEENVGVAIFNFKKEIVFCDLAENGSLSFVNIDLKKLVSLAIDYNASYIILAHNHPTGIALPSREDIKTTIQITDIFQNLGIVVLEHFIFCENDSIALFKSGIIERHNTTFKDGKKYPYENYKKVC